MSSPAKYIQNRKYCMYVLRLAKEIESLAFLSAIYSFVCLFWSFEKLYAPLHSLFSLIFNAFFFFFFSKRRRTLYDRALVFLCNFFLRINRRDRVEEGNHVVYHLNPVKIFNVRICLKCWNLCSLFNLLCCDVMCYTQNNK